MIFGIRVTQKATTVEFKVSMLVGFDALQTASIPQALSLESCQSYKPRTIFCPIIPLSPVRSILKPQQPSEFVQVYKPYKPHT